MIHKTVLVLAVILSAVFGALDCFAERLQDVEDMVLTLTNEERARAGLPALSREDTLAGIAAGHSRDMAERNYFAHRSPEGGMVSDRVAKGHRRLIGVLGENIYLYAGKPPVERDMAKDMVMKWMASPGHKANILRKEFTHLGVGVDRNGERTYATQVFAGIKAWTVQPVPVKVRQGARLNVSARGMNGMPDPVECRLFYSGSGVQASGPFRPEDVNAEAAPGAYIFRFYFPADRGGARVYRVYQGPGIAIY